jgi:hypothetical protein
MTHEEVTQFFTRLAQSKAKCQLTPGILMDVEEVTFQQDEEKRLHVLVTIGDAEWNDNFELIFPSEGGESSATPSRGAARGQGKRGSRGGGNKQERI